MTPSKKKTGVKKVAVVSTVAAVLYYLYNRAKIQILNIDDARKIVEYKVTLGLKTISGQAAVLEQTNQEHDFGGKKLIVKTQGKTLITFKIVDKNGSTLDYMEVAINSAPSTAILVPEGYNSDPIKTELHTTSKEALKGAIFGA